jgi:hypothetical protein
VVTSMVTRGFPQTGMLARRREHYLPALEEV